MTVDDVIDAIEEEHSEDVQKMGGMEALDEPYMDIGFAAIIRKRVGWLCLLFAGSLCGTDRALRGRARPRRLLRFLPLI